MQVFKFGGASVNSAAAVRNMANIVKAHAGEGLVVVVSAMGKTTNALERVIPGIGKSKEERTKVFDELKQYHWEIADELFEDKGHEVFKKLNEWFERLELQIGSEATSYNYDYDQTVSFGELISTTIVNEYLQQIGLESQWVDVRSIIRTDANYREGHVDWTATEYNAKERLMPLCGKGIVVTQGFIAGTHNRTTTTLGREGSDYSAAILSYCLGAQEMTIWKDVPGFLNADPKYFKNTIKVSEIPYNEAIELAYYGASVIHPKTVQPIQNKGIRLHIRSFLDWEESGSVVGPFEKIEPQTPLYIVKHNQVLISIHSRDFSFIAEDKLQTIFAILASLNIRVNLMQNTALSFSICIDHNETLLAQLRERLSKEFHVRYNTDLQLITIRYYTQEIIDQMVEGRPVLLQQRTRVTTQLLTAAKK